MRAPRPDSPALLEEMDVVSNVKPTFEPRENQSPAITTAQILSVRYHCLPIFSAALAIPDRAALIFSAYCSGIRVDFHPPA
jgi:hypothetical protein